jgi:hypothetical protein
MFSNSARAALLAALVTAGPALAATHDVAEGTAGYSQLLAAVEDGSVTPADWSAEVAGLVEEPEIEILRLSEIGVTGEAQARALNDALLKAGADIEATRTSIRAQMALEDALDAHDMTSEDVVAVEVSGDSRVTLYVDDSAM